MPSWKGSGFARYAWAILFGIWGLHFLLSLRDFFPSLQDVCLCFPGGKTPILASTGMTWSQFSSADPGIASFVSSVLVDDGIRGASLAVFGMIVSSTSFRRGERWAWYVQWLMPAGILAAQINVYELTGSINILLLAVVFTLVGVFALVGSHNQFFKPGMHDEAWIDKARNQTQA